MPSRPADREAGVDRQGPHDLLVLPEGRPGDHLRVDARGLAGLPDAARHVEGLHLGPLRVRHLQGERRRLEPAQADRRAGLRRRGDGVPGRRLDHLHVDALGRPRAVADGRRRQEPRASSRTRPATTAARSSRRTARRSCGARRGRRARTSTKYKELLAQNLVKPTKMDLWVANADGTEAHQVTYLPGASFAPYFYPDGKRDHLRVELPRAARPRVRSVRDQHRRHAPRADHVRAAASTASRCSRPTARRCRSRRTAATSSRRTRATSTASPARRPASTTPTCSSPMGSTTRRARRSTSPRPRSPTRSRRGRRTSPTTRAKAAASARRASRTPQRLGPAAARGGGRRARARRPVAPAVRGHDRDQARREDGARDRRQGGRRRRLRADAVLGAAARSTGDDRRRRLGHRRRGDQARRLQGQEREGQDRARPSLRAAGRQARRDGDRARLGDLRYKAFIAKQKGAVGMIVVDDGDPKQDEAPLPALVPAARDGATAMPASPIVVVKRTAARGAREGHAQGASSPSRSSRCARRPRTSSA